MRQLRWAGPRFVQLGTGIAWWFVTTTLLAAAELVDTVDRPAVDVSYRAVRLVVSHQPPGS